MTVHWVSFRSIACATDGRGGCSGHERRAQIALGAGGWGSAVAYESCTTCKTRRHEWGRIWPLTVYAKSARENIPNEWLNELRKLADHAEID